MIESNFEYTEKLISKINSSGIKKDNLITEIAMFIILLGSVIMFVTDNIFMGLISSVVFVVLIGCLVSSNISIRKSNQILIGQRVKVVFDDYHMTMTTSLGEKVLYRAQFEYKSIKKFKNKDGLMFVYFSKDAVIVIPTNSFKTVQDYKKAKGLLGNNYLI